MPGTWAGKAVGLRCLAVNPLRRSDMDFWPAPGGCPTNSASFSCLEHAQMLGPGEARRPPSVLTARGRLTGVVRPGPPRSELGHGSSSTASAAGLCPSRNRAAAGSRRWAPPLPADFHTPLKGGWPEARSGLAGSSVDFGKS